MKQKHCLNHFIILKKFDFNVRSKIAKVKQETVQESYSIVMAQNATIPLDAKLKLGELYFFLYKQWIHASETKQVKKNIGGGLRGQRNKF